MWASQSQLVHSQLLLCPSSGFVFPHNYLGNFKGTLVTFTLFIYTQWLVCSIFTVCYSHNASVTFPVTWHDIHNDYCQTYTSSVYSHKDYLWSNMTICDLTWTLCDLCKDSVMLIMTCCTFTITLYYLKMNLWTLTLTFVSHSYLTLPHHVFVHSLEWFFVTFKESVCP